MLYLFSSYFLSRALPWVAKTSILKVEMHAASSFPEQSNVEFSVRDNCKLQPAMWLPVNVNTTEIAQQSSLGWVKLPISTLVCEIWFSLACKMRSGSSMFLMLNLLNLSSFASFVSLKTRVWARKRSYSIISQRFARRAKRHQKQSFRKPRFLIIYTGTSSHTGLQMYAPT